ncbi:MAG: Sjogren's syndrome/scleroderma autoantigen 1 family protein [Candidatus Bathyarchaeia archaeon]
MLEHIIPWLTAVSLEVKKMAELLKSGAAMLSETCPECGTPLFRKGNETFCPKCNKPVVIIQSAEQETRLMTDRVLEDSEQILLGKIQELNLAMRNEREPEKLIDYGNALSSWLGSIEKLRRLKTQRPEA